MVGPSNGAELVSCRSHEHQHAPASSHILDVHSAGTQHRVNAQEGRNAVFRCGFEWIMPKMISCHLNP